MSTTSRPSRPDHDAGAYLLPFDGAKLDGLMEGRGVDVVLATSGHNTQYLTGGYRFFMYARADSIGLSRYLPVVGYVGGRPDAAFYIGAGNEDWGTEVEDLWVPEVENVAWSSVGAAERAADMVRSRAGERPTVAVECPYLAADAMETLRRLLPGAKFLDATRVLEELRAVKSPAELDLLQRASEDVVASMLATFEGSGEGDSKRQIVEHLRREETGRGLAFAYCLVSMGRSFNRAPSGQLWEKGDVLSLDSGGERDGYFGDLVRMCVLGEPTDRMEELLAEIEAVQQAARRPIRAGATGAEIYEAALTELRDCPDAGGMSFLAHGTGLVTHEAPRLTDEGSPPYPADHRDRPLEAGMVISVETHVLDPEVGFVKLEDTVFVTPDGWEAPADTGRGWNLAGG